MNPNSAPVPPPASPKQLRQSVREMISKGDTAGALDLLCNNEWRVAQDIGNNILLMCGEFTRYKDDYRRGTLSLEHFTVHCNRLHLRLLEVVERIQRWEPTPTPTAAAPLRHREVQFHKKGLNLVFYEAGRAYDLIYETGWIGYRFFVKGERKKRTRGRWKLNLLSYAQQFDFTVPGADDTVGYRLRLTFSIVTGLLVSYLLTRENAVLLESNIYPDA